MADNSQSVGSILVVAFDDEHEGLDHIGPIIHPYSADITQFDHIEGLVELVIL